MLLLSSPLKFAPFLSLRKRSFIEAKSREELRRKSASIGQHHFGPSDIRLRLPSTLLGANALGTLVQATMVDHRLTPRVLVTGATGFVAHELVKQLLEKGYDVVGSVRSKSNRLDTLRSLAAALPGSLELIEADVLVPGSLDTAVQGCSYIFHTASPFKIEVDDPQKDLIDVAVNGTKNVLASVAKSKEGVKRVVLTSSVAAVHGEYGAPPKSGSLYTEEDYNETSTIEQGQAYHMSKTLAEKAAWDICKQQGIDLVTICPNFVLGPMLSPKADSLSMGYIKGILEGGAIEGALCISDVRDVAKAHVLAAETPSAHGRYIISQRSTVPTNVISETLRQRFPQIDIQTGAHQEAEEKIDASKVSRDLGLVLHSAESTLVDMAATAIQLGLAQPKMQA